MYEKGQTSVEKDSVEKGQTKGFYFQVLSKGSKQISMEKGYKILTSNPLFFTLSNGQTFWQILGFLFLKILGFS